MEQKRGEKKNYSVIHIQIAERSERSGYYLKLRR